ncbi:MAG: hypothetical protein AB7U73_05130 [Pirellulales bacterium]
MAADSCGTRAFELCEGLLDDAWNLDACAADVEEYAGNSLILASVGWRCFVSISGLGDRIAMADEALAAVDAALCATRAGVPVQAGGRSGRHYHDLAVELAYSRLRLLALELSEHRILITRQTPQFDATHLAGLTIRVPGEPGDKPTRQQRFDAADALWKSALVKMAEASTAFDADLLRKGLELERVGMVGVPAAIAGPGTFLDVSSLAKRHDVNPAALRGRLDRWRAEHDAGFREVTNRKPKEPKYLYLESAVLPLIQELKSKAN